MKRMRNLFILSGGIGSEREVSLLSGRNVVDTLRSDGVVCEEIIVEQDRTWIYKGAVMSEGDGLQMCKENNVLVFHVIHGTYGEDGELIKKLEEYGILYVGSSSEALQMTIDKYTTETLLKKSGIKTTDSFLIKSVEDILKLEDLSFPLIVKPNHEGSSIGVVKVDTVDELRASLIQSIEVYGDMLLQKCLTGREFTCGVLEIDGDDVALTPSEVILTKVGLFDYDAKYKDGGGGLEVTPAEVGDEITKKIQELALLVHTVTGCKDISRTDMMMNEYGELVVLEINTAPGMTKMSFIPAQMKVSSYTLAQFVTGMIKKYSHS